MPGTGSAWRDVKSPVGSRTLSIPVSLKSKQPTSSLAPKRFLIARIRRKREWRSPSNCRTTSTICSSKRGPAIEPSFVTCPTRSKVMSRSLQMRISAPATSRTWVTPPGEPSAVEEPIVCTESMMRSSGFTASICAITAPKSVSEARKSCGSTALIRSARSRTWDADSSPEM